MVKIVVHFDNLLRLISKDGGSLSTAEGCRSREEAVTERSGMCIVGVGLFVV